MKRLITLFSIIAFPVLAQFAVEEQMHFCAYTNDVGEIFRWRMKFPQYPDEDRKYPLIVFLHGSGECGVDNKSHIRLGLPNLLKSLRLLNIQAIVMAPQCQRGNWWVKRLAMSPSYRMAGNPMPSLEVLMELIDHVRKTRPVDADRIYITGLSLGGFATWEAVMRYPDVFAAAVPICGGGDVHEVRKLRGLPVWIFHGDKDRNVSVECSRRMVRAMRDAGCRKVFYTEYPGVKHNSWDKAYRDTEMIRWLFDQKKTARKPWWKFWQR
ncbi:MAG: prolyl oligopeptidase family serine peptidase [Kiritimatiellia bacterium]